LGRRRKVADGGEYRQVELIKNRNNVLVEVFAEQARHSRMIWTNPVIPMDGFCLVYLFAEIDV